MECLTLVVSIFAAVGAIANAWALIRYSRINVVNGLQQLMLTKANFCNTLWGETRNASFQPQISIKTACIPVISEIIISIQLLDNSLIVYSEQSRRRFLIHQFWIELNTSLREFIKSATSDEFEGGLRNQIAQLKGIFEPFFQDY
jgi:hypothetical protein